MADVIIYGATGYTGVKICQEFALNPPKSWIIAGRSKSKLEKLSSELKCSNPPKVVVADLHELDFIKGAKVLINCVGPFRLYGEPVVKACVEHGVNYIDICGETEVIEKLYADYNQLAIDKRISIVPACGYDSVPADLGQWYTKLQFQKQQAICSTIEMIVKFHAGKSGITGNATTFESAILGFASVDNLRQLRKKTHRSVPTIGRSLHVYRNPRWDKRVDCWTVPAAVADVPLVKLGQQMIENHHDAYKKGVLYNLYKPPHVTPVHFAGYFGLTSYISVLFLSWIGFLLNTSKWLTPLRKLLIRFPAFFTFGVFKKSGPTEAQLREGGFTTTFIGHGFRKGSDYNGDTNVKIVTAITGPEAGYITTSRCIVSCATCFLSRTESEQLPFGVLTPAAAFSNVFDSLLSRLGASGIHFQVIEQ
ncbi:hypothetical protein HDV04_001588 [Boothiomyces sp. JEL0838]|nr:hypothetical protein HDV04_001588 [Boothiomyces sp. JEL0838]